MSMMRWLKISGLISFLIGLIVLIYMVRKADNETVLLKPEILIEVEGEREHGVDLAVWKEIDLTFNLTGTVDPAKAFRAVSLSIEKYCSVAETLRRAGASIRFRVFVNGESVNA